LPGAGKPERRQVCVRATALIVVLANGALASAYLGRQRDMARAAADQREALIYAATHADYVI